MVTLMGTTEILEEINKLSFKNKPILLEEMVKSIRKAEIEDQMRQAAELLYEDYSNDSNLTSFTVLDCEGDFVV